VNARPYPEFTNFYECYLHPDWGVDDATFDDVVRRFLAAEGERSAGRLLRELRSLKATEPSDSDVEQALGPWTSFDPAVEGRGPREWVDHFVSVLAAAL
jgi:hypothetical protein